MLESLSTPRNRTLTFVFIAIFCLSAAAAAVIGVSDNPPGIIMAFIAAIALVLAFVHPWRAARRFVILLLVSVFGFVLLAVLHNLFEGAAGEVESVVALRVLLQVLSVTTFLIAILICPPAIVVGAVGSIVMAIRNRRLPIRNNDADA